MVCRSMRLYIALGLSSHTLTTSRDVLGTDGNNRDCLLLVLFTLLIESSLPGSEIPGISLIAHENNEESRVTQKA